jgi:GR25 family glycosyltransferase involved in LPS biosynthesis
MKAMAERLTGLGLSYERFPAYAGAKLGRDFIERNYPQLLGLFDRKEALGAIGCFISHVEVSKMLLSRAIDRACIMEDDAEFDDDFPKFISEDAGYPEWAEAIKLESSGKRKYVMCSHVERIAGRRLVYVPGNNTNGSACYIMTKRGAGKVVDTIAKAEFRGVDHLLFDYRLAKIKSVHILPYPARQCGFLSTVNLVSAAKRKIRKRKTIAEVLRIRFKGSANVLGAFLASKQVIGAKMLNLSISKMQTRPVGRWSV